VTNYHVIKDAQRAQVTITPAMATPGRKQTTVYAKLVGAEPDKDLAVLRVEVEPAIARPISVGLSHGLLVGQKTFAIGNPFGLDHSLSTGVISCVTLLTARSVHCTLRVHAPEELTVPCDCRRCAMMQRPRRETETDRWHEVEGGRLSICV